MKDPESFKEKSESSQELLELEKLPDELLLEVLSFTTAKDQLNLTKVNKKFNELANDPYLELHKAKQKKLKQAVICNQIEMVKKLLSAKNINVNFVYENDMSLLHLLAIKIIDQKGCLEIAQLLLENGANVNSADKNGETPLHKAVASGNTFLAQLFVEKGADINVLNKEQQKPADKTRNKKFQDAINTNSQWEAAVTLVQNEQHESAYYSFPCGGGNW